MGGCERGVCVRRVCEGVCEGVCEKSVTWEGVRGRSV